jgi:hypothetical protein
MSVMLDKEKVKFVPWTPVDGACGILPAIDVIMERHFSLCFASCARVQSDLRVFPSRLARHSYVVTSRHRRPFGPGFALSDV